MKMIVLILLFHHINYLLLLIIPLHSFITIVVMEFVYSYNFLHTIVMIIINYCYIIYNQLNYFTGANVEGKVYQYSHARTRRLTIFCVKLTYMAILP